jgi:partner of Y14 and mago
MTSRPATKPDPSKSGIQTAEDGASFIPSSQRADGSTRKEIKVRPGYKPPEDVETYKNRTAEGFRSRGGGGIPGAELVKDGRGENEVKSKNARRREAAKKNKAAVDGDATTVGGEDIASAMENTTISERTEAWHDPSNLPTTPQHPSTSTSTTADDDQQKKIRNQLKKLRAIHDLREKRSKGEKLSPDQIMKIGKEEEIRRDLRKLGYDGLEVSGKEGDVDAPP